MFNRIRTILTNRQGVGMVEWIIIIGVIAYLGTFIVPRVNTALSEKFDSSATSITEIDTVIQVE